MGVGKREVRGEPKGGGKGWATFCLHPLFSPFTLKMAKKYHKIKRVVEEF